jgi:hypothetical protein
LGPYRKCLRTGSCGASESRERLPLRRPVSLDRSNLRGRPLRRPVGERGHLVW